MSVEVVLVENQARIDRVRLESMPSKHDWIEFDGKAYQVARVTWTTDTDVETDGTLWVQQMSWTPPGDP